MINNDSFLKNYEYYTMVHTTALFGLEDSVVKCTKRNEYVRCKGYCMRDRCANGENTASARHKILSLDVVVVLAE